MHKRSRNWPGQKPSVVDSSYAMPPPRVEVIHQGGFIAPEDHYCLSIFGSPTPRKPERHIPAQVLFAVQRNQPLSSPPDASLGVNPSPSSSSHVSPQNVNSTISAVHPTSLSESSISHVDSLQENACNDRVDPLRRPHPLPSSDVASNTLPSFSADAVAPPTPPPPRISTRYCPPFELSAAVPAGALPARARQPLPTHRASVQAQHAFTLARTPVHTRTTTTWPVDTVTHSRVHSSHPGLHPHPQLPAPVPAHASAPRCLPAAYPHPYPYICSQPYPHSYQHPYPHPYPHPHPYPYPYIYPHPNALPADHPPPPPPPPHATHATHATHSTRTPLPAPTPTPALDAAVDTRACSPQQRVRGATTPLSGRRHAPRARTAAACVPQQAVQDEPEDAARARAGELQLRWRGHGTQLLGASTASPSETREQGDAPGSHEAGAGDKVGNTYGDDVDAAAVPLGSTNVQVTSSVDTETDRVEVAAVAVQPQAMGPPMAPLDTTKVESVGADASAWGSVALSAHSVKSVTRHASRAGLWATMQLARAQEQETAKETVAGTEDTEDTSATQVVAPPACVDAESAHLALPGCFNASSCARDEEEQGVATRVAARVARGWPGSAPVTPLAFTPRQPSRRGPRGRQSLGVTLELRALDTGGSERGVNILNNATVAAVSLDGAEPVPRSAWDAASTVAEAAHACSHAPWGAARDGDGAAQTQALVWGDPWMCACSCHEATAHAPLEDSATACDCACWLQLAQNSPAPSSSRSLWHPRASPLAARPHAHGHATAHAAQLAMRMPSQPADEQDVLLRVPGLWSPWASSDGAWLLPWQQTRRTTTLPDANVSAAMDNMDEPFGAAYHRHMSHAHAEWVAAWVAGVRERAFAEGVEWASRQRTSPADACVEDAPHLDDASAITSSAAGVCKENDETATPRHQLHGDSRVDPVARDARASPVDTLTAAALEAGAVENDASLSSPMSDSAAASSPRQDGTITLPQVPTTSSPTRGAPASPFRALQSVAQRLQRYCRYPCGCVARMASGGCENHPQQPPTGADETNAVAQCVALPTTESLVVTAARRPHAPTPRDSLTPCDGSLYTAVRGRPRALAEATVAELVDALNMRLLLGPEQQESLSQVGAELLNQLSADVSTWACLRADAAEYADGARLGDLHMDVSVQPATARGLHALARHTSVASDVSDGFALSPPSAHAPPPRPLPPSALASHRSPIPSSAAATPSSSPAPALAASSQDSASPLATPTQQHATPTRSLQRSPLPALPPVQSHVLGAAHNSPPHAHTHTAIPPSLSPHTQADRTASLPPPNTTTAACLSLSLLPLSPIAPHPQGGSPPSTQPRWPSSRQHSATDSQDIHRGAQSAGTGVRVTRRSIRSTVEVLVDATPADKRRQRRTRKSATIAHKDQQN